MQQSESGWKPIAYASRSMTETELRYAQIEKEALATTWACEKFSTYVLRMKFTIETDHKPLVTLLGSKNLDSLLPRILRFRLRLARYDYTVLHVPGKQLYTADNLSRAPSASKKNDGKLQEEAETFMEIDTLNLPVSAGRLSQFQKSQEDDSLCTLVRKHCKEGWPDEKRSIPPDSELRQYWKARGHLVIDKNGLLLHGRRIVVPNSLRRETLCNIHSGHQGIQRCRLCAKISVWWPGISHDIENMIKECSICARNFLPRKEPMIPTELPQYPWQKVGVDLFQLERSKLPCSG